MACFLAILCLYNTRSPQLRRRSVDAPDELSSTRPCGVAASFSEKATKSLSGDAVVWNSDSAKPLGVAVGQPKWQTFWELATLHPQRSSHARPAKPTPSPTACSPVPPLTSLMARPSFPMGWLCWWLGVPLRLFLALCRYAPMFHGLVSSETIQHPCSWRCQGMRSES